MDKSNAERQVAIDVLKRLGSKWAILTAMSHDMCKKGIAVAPLLNEKIRMARGKIASSCFSPCEVSCSLAEIEGELFSKCDLLEEKDFMQWCDLLGEAMQGKLDYDRILGIPALKPVVSDCTFLGCTCS
jgi:hypothetical protein